jgi:putative PIN family toxin of toxin-antitoxin system
MMKAVLDTNVIVSALISQGGNPSLLLNSVLDRKMLMYYSAPVIAEYWDVLFRPAFGFDHWRVNRLLDALEEIGILETPPVSDTPMADETDRAFFDLASAAGAFLVTGNLKHYPKEPFVVTPSDMARNLREWRR